MVLLVGSQFGSCIWQSLLTAVLLGLLCLGDLGGCLDRVLPLDPAVWPPDPVVPPLDPVVGGCEGAAGFAFVVRCIQCRLGSATVVVVRCR